MTDVDRGIPDELIPPHAGRTPLSLSPEAHRRIFRALTTIAAVARNVGILRLEEHADEILEQVALIRREMSDD